MSNKLSINVKYAFCYGKASVWIIKSENNTENT